MSIFKGAGVAIIVNPIPVKSALNLMGFAAGIPRMSLTELEELKKRRLEQAVESIRHLRMRNVGKEETNVCNFKYISGQF